MTSVSLAYSESLSSGPFGRRECQNVGVRPAMSGPAAYREWPVPDGLRRYLACSWTGGLTPKNAACVEPVLPDGCMDIIWDGQRLFVAGPDTAPSWAGSGGAFAVGVRFRPGIGPLFLGLPAFELRDQRAELDLMWSDTRRVVERLANCHTLRHAATVLEDEAARRLPGLAAPDPVVEAAAKEWSRGAPTAAPGSWAERAGVTERQLHRRFLATVGYGPKTLQRILRLQGFLESCSNGKSGLAELAAYCGYADQAHLTREARALTGRTPAQLRASRLQV